jgi:uncharacterized surface anchored protein
VTDEHGHYAFAGLPAGDYRVRFFHGDVGAEAHVHVTADQTAKLDEALRVTQRAPVRWRWHGSSGLGGAITDQKTHESLAGVTVTATSSGANPYSELSDEDGIYALTTLPPGTYTLMFFYGDVHDEITDVPVEAGHSTVVDYEIDQSAGTRSVTRWQPPAHP